MVHNTKLQDSLFPFLVWVRKSGGDVPGRFGLDSGYIYLKFTSLHLKELVLTDRPLYQCQSMKGMDEQSDLIVLTLELKEQKYIPVPVEDMMLERCYCRDIKGKCGFLTHWVLTIKIHLNCISIKTITKLSIEYEFKLIVRKPLFSLLYSSLTWFVKSLDGTFVDTRSGCSWKAHISYSDVLIAMLTFIIFCKRLG